ncbi:MAG: hypothetical protein JWQ38_3698 [Flavipsychrobacter sp.]|nr:hypothetical protein [Flavipsychrobacter sp.]
MKKQILLTGIFSFLFAGVLLAQSVPPPEYMRWTKTGDSLYHAKQYKASGQAFSKAFAATGGRGTPNDKYDAACSWALAGIKDSAFRLLTNVASKGMFSDIDHLKEDADLVSLHSDKRWKDVCAIVLVNKNREEAKLNKPLVAILDTVFKKDQDNRVKLDSVGNYYGYNSKEMTALWETINYDDSINLIKVSAILDKHGWLGPEKLGQRGNATVFLVIQHSDLKPQQKYLPMMREAVKNNQASAADLALLEDRVALREGRKQIYGSQIHGSPDGHPWISPIEDPDNVDKRRAEVGLEPLAEYVKRYNIKWDVAEYKKQLPEIEKKDKW